MKYDVIEPKVRVVDYGPKMKLENGSVITPDEFVYAASRITYKGMDAIDELMKMKNGEINDFGEVTQEKINFKEKMIKGYINSGGRGHASLATTPVFWCFLEGTSSKLVDSIFTTVRFGSSLMPSGRRIGIPIEDIVVPKGIAEKGDGAVELYVSASKRNIETYKKVQESGVSKQEASKIVQYGHFGGGFMMVPLETLIYFSKLAEREPEAMPREGREIISQLEKFIHENGMSINDESRKASPREGCVNPNIFHYRKNWAESLKEQNETNGPIIIDSREISDEEKSRRIKEYLEHRKEIFSTKEGIENNWRKSLNELQEIPEDFGNSTEATIYCNTPWRLWGETKRHRTMPQIAESVYHAVANAKKTLRKSNFDDESFFRTISVPTKVYENNSNFHIWREAFFNSLNTYDMLVGAGVPESDAIAVIPRGLRIGVVKTYDLANLTTGYASLRMCNSAEPEMRKITEREIMDLIKHKSNLKDSVQLIAPKCHHTGFCHEEKCCGKVNQVVPDYDDDFHKKIATERAKEIREKLDSYQ